jgi:hypothetical protein
MNRTVKTAVLPAVRVEPALRADAESVLDDGESLSDFIATSVRSGVAWRRAQDAFLARAADAVDCEPRESLGMSPEELLKRMDERLKAAQSRLSARKPDPEIRS